MHLRRGLRPLESQQPRKLPLSLLVLRQLSVWLPGAAGRLLLPWTTSQLLPARVPLLERRAVKPTDATPEPGGPRLVQAVQVLV